MSKADWFIASIADLNTELDEDSKHVLRTNAEGFVRSGGILRWDEWKTLAPESQAAFIEVGNMVRHEHAQDIAFNLLSLMIPKKSDEQAHAAK